MTKKWVFLFDEVKEAEKVCWWRLGQRARSAGRQRRQPGRYDPHRCAGSPGFTVTTEACNAYLAAGEKFPAGMWDQELAALKQVEKQTGKKFGDPAESAAGFLPLRREVLHARHDGHRPQHRLER